MFFFSELHSQDIHFSQYFASPLTLNPAATGNFQGDWRAMNNFRSQWKALGIPFRTISLGFDNQLLFSNRKLSTGFIIINDQSGDEKLVVNKIYGSASFRAKLGKSALIVALQAGYVMKNYNNSKLTFPSQYDFSEGQFNNSLPNGEKPLGEKTSYADFNSGFIWNGNFGKFQPEIGFAVFHLTQPGENFTKKNYKLPMRNVAHFGGKIDLTEKLFLLPRIFFMNQTSANDLLTGALLGVNLPHSDSPVKSVFFGPLFRSGISRNSDALIGIFGLNFTKLDVGLSYDVNVSTLKSSTRNRGAFEFSIIYTGYTVRVSRVTTPCDRY